MCLLAIYVWDVKYANAQILFLQPSLDLKIPNAKIYATMVKNKSPAQTHIERQDDHQMAEEPFLNVHFLDVLKSLSFGNYAISMDKKSGWTSFQEKFGPHIC